MTTTTAPFADRLKEAMRLRGFASTRLSKLLGVSVQTIYSWRDGNTEPRAGTLPHLCLLLGVQPQWLLGMSNAGGPVPLCEQQQNGPQRYARRVKALA